jgi:hypothetical protein
MSDNEPTHYAANWQIIPDYMPFPKMTPCEIAGPPFPSACQVCGKDFVTGDTVSVMDNMISARHVGCA